MNNQELYSYYNPDIYKIDIGGSCVGKYGATNWDLAYNEIRILPFAETKAWDYIAESIKRNIRATVNIDQYITRDTHWLPGKNTYQRHVDDICRKLINTGGLLVNRIIDLTIDNEPLKDNYQPNVATYINYVKWAAEIAHRHGFKISGGNEEFKLVAKRVSQGQPDLYAEMFKLCQQGIIDYVAVHIQGSCLTESDRAKWTGYINDLKAKYQVNSIICTEANYSNPKDSFYGVWVPQIKMALDIGSETIGFVFVDVDTKSPVYKTDYSWLSMFVDGNLRVDKSIWLDFRELAINYKTEDEDMKLDEIYKEGSRGIGVRFIQMILNQDMKPELPLAVDGIWGPKTNAIVLAYQEKYNLAQYGGAIGPNTMQDMIKQYPGIWDNIQYLYAIGVR